MEYVDKRQQLWCSCSLTAACFTVACYLYLVEVDRLCCYGVRSSSSNLKLKVGVGKSLEPDFGFGLRLERSQTDGQRTKRYQAAGRLKIELI